MTVTKQWQPLEEVVGTALRRVDAALKYHRVETSIPAEPSLVPIDGMLIEQVLVNLLDNAAKYTPAGSTITLFAQAVRHGIEVAVADRGPGLDDADRERVFDKFYRSGRVAGDRGRGAGLGLAICRAIVQAHGGCIRAENREGGGACFVFTLPIDTTPPAVDVACQAGESGCDA
jgi:two-component system sensor histidine kinase KdpD